MVRGRLEDPVFIRTLLTDTRFAWLWLVLRVSVGSVWLQAGWRQLQSPPRLTGAVAAWLPQVVAAGETLAGIALILGAFVGVAAFAGGLLGSGLLPAEGGMLAPLLFAASVWLVLAWKTAGWIGLDRWLLPLVGMPWRGGALLDGEHVDIGQDTGGAVPRRG